MNENITIKVNIATTMKRDLSLPDSKENITEALNTAGNIRMLHLLPPLIVTNVLELLYKFNSLNFKPCFSHVSFGTDLHSFKQ